MAIEKQKKNKDEELEELMNSINTSKEVIETLDYTYKYAAKKKALPKPAPKFTGREIFLILQYILRKPEGWEIKSFPILSEAVKEDTKRYDETITKVVQKESGE